MCRLAAGLEMGLANRAPLFCGRCPRGLQGVDDAGCDALPTGICLSCYKRYESCLDPVAQGFVALRQLQRFAEMSGILVTVEPALVAISNRTPPGVRK